MKHKQHKAQRLLEAIGEVDSAILQQAYNTPIPRRANRPSAACSG